MVETLTGLVIGVGTAIFLSMLLGAVFEKFRQSAIIGYILGGIILGPSILGIIYETEMLRLFSELGVIFLLFYIGLELDVKKLKSAGLVPWVLGPAKLVFCFGLGYAAGFALGFSSLESILMGLIISMSSSAIVGKYLIDNNLGKSLESSIAIPVLLFQDFLAVIVIALLSSAEQQMGINQLFLNSIFFVVVVMFVIAEFSKYLMVLMEKLAYEKHLTLYALGMALVLSGLAGYFGLSAAIGAFFAGFLVSQMRSAETVRKELAVFRNFFVAFFFIGIGLAFSLPTNFYDWGVVLGAGLFVLALYLVGHHLSHIVVGTLTGLKLGFSTYLANVMLPIGEFSLLIAGLALALGMPNAPLILNIGIFLTFVSTLLMPLFLAKSGMLAEFFRRLMPRRAKGRAEGIKLQFAWMESTADSKTANTAIMNRFRKAGLYVFACFATIYLFVQAFLGIGEGLVQGISNFWLFSVAGVVVLAPFVAKILWELRELVGILIESTEKGKVVADTPEEVRKMVSSTEDLLLGIALLVLSVLGFVAVSFFNPFYLMVPLLFLAGGIWFLITGAVRSYRAAPQIAKAG